MRPGDYGCVQGTPGLIPAVIRRVTDSRDSHVVVYVGAGRIVQALAGGVSETDMACLAGRAVAWNTDEPRSVAERAATVAAARAQVGRRYNYLAILVLALDNSQLRLGRCTFGLPHRALARLACASRSRICSAVAAHAGAAAGLDWSGGKDPQLVTPADLADRITRTVWQPELAVEAP